MTDEIRLVITSEGQDPAEFHLNLPVPLELSKEWRVALTAIIIPPDIDLLNPAIDKIKIIRDKQLRPGKIHKKLVSWFDEAWKDDNKGSIVKILRDRDIGREALLERKVEVSDDDDDDDDEEPGEVGESTADDKWRVESGEEVLPGGVEEREHRQRKYTLLNLSSTHRKGATQILTGDLQKTFRKLGGTVSSKYYFDFYSHKAIFVVAENEWVNVMGNLSTAMSLTPLMYPGGVYESEYCMDVVQHNRTLYLYSNLGQEVEMGEGVYPFLQAFAVKNTDNIIEFKPPIFVPLQTHHITNVAFSLRNELGEKVRFSSKTPLTICKITFKRFPLA